MTKMQEEYAFGFCGGLMAFLAVIIGTGKLDVALVLFILFSFLAAALMGIRNDLEAIQKELKRIASLDCQEDEPRKSAG